MSADYCGRVSVALSGCLTAFAWTRQAIMRDFAIETERMEATEEIMGDTIDDVIEGDEEAS